MLVIPRTNNKEVDDDDVRERERDLPSPLLRITKHLVRLLDGVEYPSTLVYVVRVLVRMVLECQLTVGLLQV